MTTDWRSLRAREFPGLAPGYLNAAYFGPLPERTQAAARRAIAEQANPISLVYEEWRDRPDSLRTLFARLTHASPDEVTFLTSTTELVNRIAQGLRLGRGDRVAVIDGDYPSVVLPWLALERDGVVVDRLAPPGRLATASFLESELAPGTKVLALSQVAFDTGARVDLEAIAALSRERDIVLVVDVTQGLGAVTIDLTRLPGVSAIACSTYKWMLAPYGTALGVVRQSLLERLEPRWANWIASRSSLKADDLLRYTLDMLPGARGLDRGQSPALIPLAMLRASLELFLEVGPAEIAARGRSLADRLVAGLDRERYELVTPEHARASIVSLRARDTAKGKNLAESLKQAGIHASVREGKLRVSPHFYNFEDEVDALLEALALTAK